MSPGFMFKDFTPVVNYIYNVIEGFKMLSCNGKIFKKFIFFTSIFFLFSFVINMLFAAAAFRSSKANTEMKAREMVEIKIQQEKILNYLKKVENNVDELN